MSTKGNIHLFGVRHHGPGSARSLRRALEQLRPDLILVEGPPDADEILPLAASDEMKPPVAILVYDPESPQRAVFYPFAIFSPEWQAIRFALAHQIPVRFCDLPQYHRAARDDGKNTPDGNKQPDAADREARESSPPPVSRHGGDIQELRRDPLSVLAAAAGFSDGERWWDYLVESRRGAGAGVFDAIADAMISLRESPPDSTDAGSAKSSKTPDRSPLEPDDLDALREAWMRKTIRTAMKDGFAHIAVVCGAWHVPALRDPGEKGLAAAAWVPWSYDRLAAYSGYGAGVLSPEWYHLLWSDARHVAVEWLTRAARLMRKKDLDVSAAQVIDATRLAETLAALRGRPMPCLEELDEAALSVMCFGDDPPMRLIRERLVIGERLGQVPENAPLIPLQADLQRQQKSLRLPARTVEKDYDFDLRKPLDLDRSRLLHRLNLLSVPWGELREVPGRAKGTFHELWRLQWDPEFALRLVEAGRWGNTIAAAAGARVAHAAQTATDLRELAKLLSDALLADLPEAVASLIAAVQAQTAVAADVPLMMEALPPLASMSRYGNVRQTDTQLVLGVIRGLVERICIGLSNSCASLDDEAARNMFDRLAGVQSAIGLLALDDLTADWLAALRGLADQSGMHGLITGRACRTLYDGRQIDSNEAGRRLSFALSSASDPTQAAAWVEGLLAGSGLVLIHDERLWNIVDGWVGDLSATNFNDVLPLVRRTFATFAGPERRQMGERVKNTLSGSSGRPALRTVDFNHSRAEAVLPVLYQILGIKRP